MVWYTPMTNATTATENRTVRPQGSVKLKLHVVA